MSASVIVFGLIFQWEAKASELHMPEGPLPVGHLGPGFADRWSILGRQEVTGDRETKKSFSWTRFLFVYYQSGNERVLLLEGPVGDVLKKKWLLTVSISQSPSETFFNSTPELTVGHEVTLLSSLKDIGGSCVTHLEPLSPRVPEVLRTILRGLAAVGGSGSAPGRGGAFFGGFAYRAGRRHQTMDTFALRFWHWASSLMINPGGSRTHRYW
jgi:hypothetical protein